MNPATLALIIEAIEAAIKAAPQVEAIAVKGKEWVTTLFQGGLISKATQDAIHSHVDEVRDAFLAGVTPPEWTVEPDPV
jgi:hypothetical protein